MEKKVTKRDVFNAVIDMVDGKDVAVANADIKAAMVHEIELLDKKAKKAAGPNPEFAELEDKIVANLVGEMTATSIGDVVGVTSQKVTPRLKALVAAGKVTVAKVKGKNLYKLA